MQLHSTNLLHSSFSFSYLIHVNFLYNMRKYGQKCLIEPIIKVNKSNI